MHTRLLGTCLALAATLAACSAPDTPGSPEVSTAPKEGGDGQLKVVATTTQICDYATQLGKGADGIDLTCLLAPNASAHEHEMTLEQMNALGAADVLLVNGVDLEHFLDQAVDSSGFRGTMTVTSGFSGTEGAPGGSHYTLDEGQHKVDVAPWPFEPDPGEEAEFAFDPHVWTSPLGAAVQVRNIADSLDRAGGSDGTWRTRAEPYLATLKELDQWVRDSLASVPREDRVLFTSHDAFGYFARDYDVDFVGSALSDFNAQQDATADHIKAGVDQVRASGAKAIFAENSNNAKSIEAVGRAAGVDVITGEDALYGDSLGPAGTDGETYVGSIVHNVTTMVNAWGGQVAPLPDSLKDTL